MKHSILTLSAMGLALAMSTLLASGAEACPGDKKPSLTCPGDDKKPSLTCPGDKKPSLTCPGDKKPS